MLARVTCKNFLESVCVYQGVYNNEGDLRDLLDNNQAQGENLLQKANMP